MLAAVEQSRLRISRGTDAAKKARLGQFLTPERIARFMASLFVRTSEPSCRLLDPGAGIGSLSAAFLERWTAGDLDLRSVAVTACELDESLHERLAETLEAWRGREGFRSTVVGGDFVEQAVNWLQFGGRAEFTHAILNPPYRKISSSSKYRHLLRQVGIETVNLYSAFVSLTLALMAPGGQLVAIVPRSFCNGPYYRPFREFLLKRAAIRHLHLFGSRSNAFRDDDVLQENLIIVLERRGAQTDVTVTTSTDDSFADLSTHVLPFGRIVSPGDSERFIHIPGSADRDAIERSPKIRCTLDDLGIQVSTGPVVDFRLKEHLRPMPEADTVPLLYPAHFTGQRTEWPREGMKKPNAIRRNAETEKWLYPVGFYCVVRRLSSKEERRRIVASVVEPHAFPGAPALGFENHLNVFHERKQGLPERLALGLAVFLNATAVDEHFRSFNGHTQVNATDLRLLKYPNREALLALGDWARGRPNLTQAAIDEQLEGLAA